jgi:hypothetical protein
MICSTSLGEKIFFAHIGAALFARARFAAVVVVLACAHVAKRVKVRVSLSATNASNFCILFDPMQFVLRLVEF